MDSPRPVSRWVSAAEVAVFYTVAITIIWWGQRARGTALIASLVLVPCCAYSNWRHGDSLVRIGLSTENFLGSLRLVAMTTLPLIIPLWIAAWRNWFWVPWSSGWTPVTYAAWALVQEYAMLGFVGNRLEEALQGHEVLVPWANGFLFSMAHLPNPLLMIASFVAGVLFTTLFFRRRNLYPIALAHALVGTGIGVALGHLPGIMSVGPGYLRRVGNPPFGF